MTERERWIVYPLLFLALGASLRDKLAKQTRSQQIVCEELFVVNDRGEPVARLAEGSLMLEGSDNTPGTLTVDLIQTKNLQAQNIVQRGKPVGDVVSWNRLLQLFQQLGLIRMAPLQTVPVVPTPLPSSAIPLSQPMTGSSKEPTSTEENPAVTEEPSELETSKVKKPPAKAIAEEAPKAPTETDQ